MQKYIIIKKPQRAYVIQIIFFSTKKTKLFSNQFNESTHF
jgi:hypothetical protein